MRFVKTLLLSYVKTKFRLLSAISKRKAAEEAFLLFTTPQERTLNDLSPLFQKGDSVSLEFEGNITRGFRWNHPSDKKVLILHGYESSVTNFEPYISPLIGRGYEVLAFDAPAHGRSNGTQINALIYKNWILQLIQKYGPVKSFIAHSLGGLALSLALEDINHDETYKVALIAPATETTTAVNRYFQLLNIGDRIKKEFEEVILQTGGKDIGWYSINRAAQYIKAKVLFIQDRDDTITPFTDVAPIMEKQLPNFHFIITEGLGHRRIYKDDMVVSKIIEFL
jgi:pimeloyl-ACP methyl ester carboxylesterase